jgi:hypothetical protein
MKVRTRFALAAALILVLAAGASVASANSTPYTRGDAEALFNAGNTGGFGVRLHGGVIEGAPADRSQRIGPGQNFQGFHICADDWHVMFINLIITDSADGPQTLHEARAFFATVEVTYELDGAPLATDVTPVKPWLGDLAGLDPDATVAFAQVSGAILAPDELSVGAHTERVRVYIDGVLSDDLGDVTFFVDEAGTGACL